MGHVGRGAEGSDRGHFGSGEVSKRGERGWGRRFEERRMDSMGRGRNGRSSAGEDWELKGKVIGRPIAPPMPSGDLP